MQFVGQELRILSTLSPKYRQSIYPTFKNAISVDRTNKINKNKTVHKQNYLYCITSWDKGLGLNPLYVTRP